MIAIQNLLIDYLNETVGPSQTFHPQPNVAESSDIMSDAYTQPISPGANQTDSLSQELLQPTSEPPRSLSTAPSSNPYQTTQPGSSTQPSFQATTSTNTSLRETQTKASEASRDSNPETDTRKPSETEDSPNDGYDFQFFDVDSALHETGGQFDDLQGTGASSMPM
jgi:hypothetical protein